MDILDILVSEQEMATLDEDLRPIWEDGGMICPANGCHTFLRTYSLCRKHWAEIHENMVTMYTCEAIQECRFTASRRNRVVRHIRKLHLSKQRVVGRKVIRNRTYKDPGIVDYYPSSLWQRLGVDTGQCYLKGDTKKLLLEPLGLSKEARRWGPASKKTVTKV